MHRKGQFHISRFVRAGSDPRYTIWLLPETQQAVAGSVGLRPAPGAIEIRRFRSDSEGIVSSFEKKLNALAARHRGA